MRSEAPDEGIYMNVPGEEYATWDAISHSRLRDLEISPRRCKYFLDHPEDRKGSTAMTMGRAIHQAILEPDLFKANFGELPSDDNRTTDNKLAHKEFDEQGIEGLKPGEMRRIDKMVDAVLGHPQASKVLAKMEAAEVSAVAAHEESGLVRKTRPDIYAPEIQMMGDLKTMPQIPGENELRAKCFNHGWLTQGAMAEDVVNCAIPPTCKMRHYVILAVETEPPHGVELWAIDDGSMELGLTKHNRLMEMYARCLKSGRWPGVTDHAIGSLSAPPWAFSTEEMR